MILQRIALFAVETETLPRGLTNSRIFHHHLCHAGKRLGERRHFQVEVDQQPYMQGFLPVMMVHLSKTVGLAPADINTGEAAIFAPMDRGLPADGVVAQTTGDQVWAIADLDLDALDRSRADAQVANDRDWMGQLKPALARAKLQAL